MSTGSIGLIAAVVAASVATTNALRAGTPLRLSVPMVCSRGPSGQRFDAIVTLPATVAEGSAYAIRIDGVPSGRVSHAGLNYIHDMSTDYVVPAGATYVAGSARVIPGTARRTSRRARAYGTRPE